MRDNEQTPMTVGIETINPEEAERLLGGGGRNRSLAQSYVEWIATQMVKGRWICNGESIIFDERGRLMDGQHRLAACVESGTPFESVVVRGVPRRAAFATIGGGRGRSVADVLKISGESEQCMLASALGWLWRYEHKGMLTTLRALGWTARNALALLRRHPNIRDAINEVRSKAMNPLRPVSGMATIYYLYASIEEKKATTFMAQVRSGEGIRRGDPAYALRRWLLNRGQGGKQPRTSEILAVTAKAFRAYFEGERIITLAWKRSGKSPEEFPALMPSMESMGPALRAGTPTRGAQATGDAS